MRGSDGLVVGMIAGAVIGAGIVMMMSPGVRREAADGMGNMVDNMGSRMGRVMRRGRRVAAEMMPEDLG